MSDALYTRFDAEIGQRKEQGRPGKDIGLKFECSGLTAVGVRAFKTGG
jgi:hypothetical protein